MRGSRIVARLRLLVLPCAVFIVAPTAAAAPGGATVIHVTSTFEGSNDTYSVDPQTGRVTFTGHETDHGTWSTEMGSDYYEGSGTSDPNTGRIEFWATHWISGTVQGCGTGTFVIEEHGSGDPLIDPLAGGAHVTADWWLRKGSGTGGLAGLRSGTGTFDYYFANSFKDGRTDGTMTCIPPKPHS
jgi:hypothetical protein